MDEESNIDMDRLKASMDTLGGIYDDKDIVKDYVSNHHKHFNIGKNHLLDMLDNLEKSLKKHFGVEDEDK